MSDKRELLIDRRIAWCEEFNQPDIATSYRKGWYSEVPYITGTCVDNGDGTVTFTDATHEERVVTVAKESITSGGDVSVDIEHPSIPFEPTYKARYGEHLLGS